MKVLIYFSGKLFESKGTPIRTRNMIAQLQKNGVEIFYAGYDVPKNINKAHVLMLQSPFLRGFQLASFVRKHNIQIVYFQTSAGIWFAPFISFLTKARAGVDFHSRRLQEEHIYQKRPIVLTFFLEQLELVFCRFLSFGTSVAETITEYYSSAVKTFLTLPVGVDTSLFTPDILPNEEVSAWKGNAFLIAYAGNTKWYQGVGTVLSAFEKFYHKNSNSVKFLIIASSGVEDMHAYAHEHNLSEGMYILDKQPHDAIPGLLAAADVLTVVRPSDLVTEYSFPSKLPEYAALGKALIVSRVSDIESYIIDRENGIVVNPNDIDGVYEGLELLQDPEIRTRFGEKARLLAEKTFDIDILGMKLYAFLNGIVEN